MSGWVAGSLVVGAVVQGVASKHAADQQSEAARAAAKTTSDQWNITNQQEAPYRQSGEAATAQLNYLLGIGPAPTSGSPLSYEAWSQQQQGGRPPSMSGGPGGAGMRAFNLNEGRSAQAGADTSQAAYQRYVSGYQGPSGGNAGSGGYGSLTKPFTIDDFHKLSPAYAFESSQGRQGVLNADSANGGALSGAAQKDLMDYNYGKADQAWNTAFNQYNTQQNNIYSRLSGMATLGQNAAANTGTIGAELAKSTAQSQTNAGSAQAAGTMGEAKAFGSIASLPWLYKH